MEMKIKLPKRFYTVEQLAERWECSPLDIKHLIITGLLNTDTYINQVLESPASHVTFYPHGPAEHHEVIAVVSRFRKEELKWITPQEAVENRVTEELTRSECQAPVITADEVARFEREHGEPTEDTAPPSAWPWGDYERPLLRILADAVDHFCVKNDLARYPKKESDEVANWIMDRMKTNGMPVSKSLAGAIETLISPRDYSHQRQRKQGKP